MTQDQAEAAARDAAERTNEPWQVFRLPAWPANVYSVRAVARGLPIEATKHGAFQPVTRGLFE